MHLTGAPRHTHDHFFLDAQHGHAERRTQMVVALTAATMAAELAAGTVFQSMALIADGWHMASHVTALGLAAFAYSYARRHARDQRYSFGTGKVGALAGYTSAVVLGIIALAMGYESIGRLIAPVPIDFAAATWIAVLGLVVNLVSAALLGGHDHDHAHAHTDQNLRSAYVHVLADAFTSLTAIIALTGGRLFGWVWLDPVMGLVGMGVILAWSRGLIRDCRRVLLDADVSAETVAEIRRRVEDDADNRITDLHVWRVGSHHLAAIISLMTHHVRPPDHYKALLAGLDLAHVTVEVVPCPDA
jgi:cation diffusion facilitator family transporter